jgi:hypothetical protein
MSNFELIDDYLTNRLSEQDQKSFEQQMAADPALKADVELQKEIIQGLKSARVAELKAMLNKVPVSTPTIYLSPLRIAAGLIGAAVLATGLYYFSDRNDNLNTQQVSSSLIDSTTQKDQNKTENPVDSSVNEVSDDVPVDKKDAPVVSKNNDKRISTHSKESKPAIDLIDPTEELTENETDVALEKTGVKNPSISVVSIEVDVNSSERKFKSHYQFANGKLVLYGNFDKGLYEIIEVNAQNSRSLFLYYKTSYYQLDEAKKEVTPLKEITDPVLIQKLKIFRSN